MKGGTASTIFVLSYFDQVQGPGVFHCSPETLRRLDVVDQLPPLMNLGESDVFYHDFRHLVFRQASKSARREALHGEFLREVARVLAGAVVGGHPRAVAAEDLSGVWRPGLRGRLAEAAQYVPKQDVVASAFAISATFHARRGSVLRSELYYLPGRSWDVAVDSAGHEVNVHLNAAQALAGALREQLAGAVT
ncbi:MAG: hypothetical protein Kow0069_09110 [Promethearchaeota archaeon]